MDEMVEKIKKYCARKRGMMWDLVEVSANKELVAFFQGQAFAYECVIDYITELIYGGENDE